VHLLLACTPKRVVSTPVTPCNPARMATRTCERGGRITPGAGEGTSHSPSASHSCQPRVPEGEGASQPVPRCLCWGACRGCGGEQTFPPSATRVPAPAGTARPPRRTCQEEGPQETCFPSSGSQPRETRVVRETVIHSGMCVWGGRGLLS
jgi:hypothetical protein